MALIYRKNWVRRAEKSLWLRRSKAGFRNNLFVSVFTIFAIIETVITTLSVTYIRTKFDSVTFSMNGTFISVCVSSQTDSWANLYRVKKPLIAEWKKEIALRPITPPPPPSFG